jgi:hypothetical protein
MSKSLHISREKRSELEKAANRSGYHNATDAQIDELVYKAHENGVLEDEIDPLDFAELMPEILSDGDFWKEAA